MADQCVNVQKATVGPLTKTTEVKTSVDAVSTPRKDKIVAAVKNAQLSTISMAKDTQDKTVALVKKSTDQTVALMKNPQFQVVTVSSASGAVIFGAVGGAFGCMSGIVVGGLAGTIPALLTFGTSIPIGAFMGGCVGAPAGACTAAVVGATAGGSTGQLCWVYRGQIKDGVLQIRLGATKKAGQMQLALNSTRDTARSFAMDGTQKVRFFVAKKSREVSDLAIATKMKGHQVVTDKSFQVTTGSAVAGGVAGGAAGGVVGGVAGAGTGALVGVPAALFTFGLSIPVCAAIGGGMGLVAGATTGATTGGVAGGAAGYTTHKYRREIGSSARLTWSNVQSGAIKLKVKAMDGVTHVTSMVSGTGGTTGAGL